MKRHPTSGWGLYPVVESCLEKVRFPKDLVSSVRSRKPFLPQGNRRSYGDACLFDRVFSTLSLDHLLAFDSERGLLRAEAGIPLEEIIRFALPRGWFLPVTPGTKFPTLGGCIAADVHGKNHHVDGTIGNFIDELEMVLADGSWVRCSRSEMPDLFGATLGGMGLTGFIYAATLRLRKVDTAYIQMRAIRTDNLAEACRIFAETSHAYTYSVAWTDCLARGSSLGRSIVMLGNHAPKGTVEPSRAFRLHARGRLSVPFFFPGIALNAWSVKAFNALYYRRQVRRQVDALVHYDPFFYPLDAISHWNRIYGRGGFLQYQFVIPFADGQEIMTQVLERIADRGIASFLAVLKTLGPQEGLLSFPMPGYTLALDIPLHSNR
jgi:FAD/FMN-containing dehydrogenase